MQDRAYKLQSEMIKALAHPTRIAILEMLRHGEVCVCELEPALGLRQANISQHLMVLRAKHLVTTRREGVRVFYRVADERIFQVLDLLFAITHDQLNQARRALVPSEASVAQ